MIDFTEFYVPFNRALLAALATFCGVLAANLSVVPLPHDGVIVLATAVFTLAYKWLEAKQQVVGIA